MTEVTNTQENAVAVPTMEAWGSETPLESNDIIIPKILLMQSDSTLVVEEKAKNKDFVNSSTKAVVKKINFVPFHCKKVLKVSKKIGNRSEFVREEVWSEANDKNKKEWNEGSDTYFSQKIWRFYGLLNDEVSPYVVDLRGMSFNTGKQLANQMYITNKLEKRVPAAYSVDFSTEIQEYEDAKKNVFVYKLGAKTSGDKLAKAYEWFKTIKTMNNVIVDNNEKAEETNNVTQAEMSSDDIPF